jgi:predicted metal-dependent hydrolase
MAITTESPPPARDQTARIERLSTASLKRVIEPDVEVAGSVGPGQVLARELLSVADLNLDLDDEQWARLSREEVASIMDAGVRFESVLMAGFGLMLAWRRDLVDPRVTYVLHEIGEETRHSRLFLRVIEQLQPQAVNPFMRGIFPRLDRYFNTWFLRRQALFCVMVLTGEEAPDLIQRLSSEHPETDPFLRQVNKYHRMEEARHLSFARTLLPELWAEARPFERFLLRHLAPLVMAGIFDSLIHPGVYATVGLPGWATWRRVRKSESRQRLRAESFRPVCAALQNAGAFGRRGRLPKSWQRACQVDPAGRPRQK